jgi:uncharacterized membrane protein YbhN (UPF0104 family)
MKAESYRISGASVRTVVAAIIAVLLSVYVWQNWEIMRESLAALAAASPLFLFVGTALVALTFVFAARAYGSLSLMKLPLRELIVIEFAATAINRIFPSGLGGMGAHGLYLFNRGHSKTAAALVVGTNNILGFLAHSSLLLAALLLAPWAVQEFELPSFDGFVFLVGLALVAFGVWFAKRRGAYGAVNRNVRKTMRAYKRQPSKLGVAALSLMGLTVTNFAIFMLACAAMGISVPLVTGFLIYSVGVLVGAATPTPGGLAGVEAGLVAGLLAVNVDEVSAIAAVLAFRFVTFWLPLIPSVVALFYVRKKNLFQTR